MADFDPDSMVAIAAQAEPIPACHSWRPGLQILARDFSRSGTFRPGAAEAARGSIIDALRARFRVENWYDSHPEIAATPITRPLIILGMPRAGTTLLVNLLRFDPQRRIHWNWEGNRETPPVSASHIHDDPRIALRVAEVDRLIADGIIPLNHHVERGDEPTECHWILGQDFKSFSWLVRAQVPDYFEWWMNDADLAAAYAYHRRYLGVLQSAAPGSWTIKFPSHALAIEEILATYPDARIVYTHRDPIKPVGSTCSLNEHPLSVANSSVDRAMIGHQVSQILAKSATRMIAARDRHPDLPFFDMHYANFVRDPMAMIRELYRFEGLELSEQVDREMREELARHDRARSQAGAHRYRLDDYGLDVAMVDRMFGDYVERFQVELERG